jgi:hypothetical protein
MQQMQSNRFWKPAAFGGALFSVVGLYEPVKDLYLKVYDPDYKGVVSVTMAEHQLKLADQNAECFLSMKRSKVQLNDSVAISYGACQNNNIHLGVYPRNKPAYQRWIEPNREQDLARLGGLGGIFSTAFAGALAVPSDPAAGASPVIPAQVELLTVCQQFQDQDKRKVIRITNEGGQCFFERVNILTGVVEVREKSACEAQCPAEAEKYN